MALIGLLGATAPAASSLRHGPIPEVERIELRSLPSLVVEWEWHGQVDRWHLEDGVAYLVGGGRLSALDAVTGEPLWAYEMAQDCSCSKIELLPERLVAGIDGRLILVDRASGVLVADVALGRSITELEADPLVAAFKVSQGSYGIVALDEVSGVELARYQTAARVADLFSVGERLVVELDPRRAPRVLVGLDRSLREVWRRPPPDNSHLVREGDELIVNAWGRGGGQVRWLLDPETGRLSSKPLVAGEEASMEVAVTSLAGGLAQVLRHGEPPELVRPDPDGGEPLWRTELPFVVDASAVWRERAVLVSPSWGGRGAVMLADLADGSLEGPLAGLRRMSQLSVHGDLLLSETASGLAAARLDRFGPSEASSSTVEESVRAILESLMGDESALDPWDVHRELEELGAAAMPYLAEEIPVASGEVLEMIARLVGEHRYRRAAAALAARLEEALAVRDTEAEEPDSTLFDLGQVAHPLAAIAGAEQVPVLVRLLEGGSEDEIDRAAVLAALGRLAPERALSVIEDWRDRYPPPTSWFQVPSAAAWVEVARREVPSGDFGDLVSDRAEAEIRALMRRATSAFTGTGTEGWVLFPDSRYGADDLWAAPVDAEGLVGEASFVGPRPAPGRSVVPFTSEFVPLEARLGGGVLDVGFPASDRLVVPLSELGLDSDGDGLSDRLEEHLELDPAAADSDADGLADPVDPAPRGGESEPTREEQAFLALHEVLALIDSHEAASDDDPAADPLDDGRGPEGLFLTDVRRLEWRAGPRPTFLLERRGSDDCHAGSYRVSAEPPRRLEDGEIAVDIVSSCAELFQWGNGPRYVLRETPGGWVLSGIHYDD